MHRSCSPGVLVQRFYRSTLVVAVTSLSSRQISFVSKKLPALGFPIIVVQLESNQDLQRAKTDYSTGRILPFAGNSNLKQG